MKSFLFALLCLAMVHPTFAQPSTTLRVQDEVIYELFVRNATPEGTFDAAQRLLPHIRSLGTTTLWLMPIQPTGLHRRKGTLGSPYSIRDYTAVNPELGTAESFRAFVAAAQAHGMKVILDWVANHTAWDHPWMRSQPTWYTRNAQGQVVPPVEDWYDVADLNYDAPGVHDAMIDAMKFWIREFNLDGFRCDVAELVPQAFWQRAIAELRQEKQPLLMLAEGHEDWLYDVGFDLTYDWPLYKAMIAVFRDNAPADTLLSFLNDTSRLRMRLTTNHDETAWDDTPDQLFGGMRGALAAYSIVAALPGAPLIYNGQEVGSPNRTGLFDREPLPQLPGDPTLQAYRDALTLRRAFSPLRSMEIRAHGVGPDAVLLERTESDERVLVLVNVRNREVEVTLPQITDIPQRFTLPPFGVQRWVRATAPLNASR